MLKCTTHKNSTTIVAIVVKTEVTTPTFVTYSNLQFEQKKYWPRSSTIPPITALKKLIITQYNQQRQICLCILRHYSCHESPNGD